MRALLTALAIMFATVSVCYATSTPVTSDEAAAWIRYTVPLPRSVSISSKVSVAPTSVGIYGPATPDIVTIEATGELRVSMGLSAGAPNPASPAFTITMQIGGPESSGLSSLKNSDQAYKILPETGDTGLRLVALGTRGLYYAAKTVQQLIAAKLAPGVAQIPMLTVTDWPELRDRGVWGNDSFNRTRWMADRKMNYQEQIAARSLDGSCIGHASAKTGHDVMYTEGPYYGLEPCEAILHMEQVANGTTLFTCYPIVQGVSAAAGVWCY